jgi:hypothetical protein
MLPADVVELHSHIHLVRHATNVGERNELYRRAARGEVTSVVRGCYLDTSFLEAMSNDERHRALAHCCALTFGEKLVFSHRTAAALWRLPVLGEWPTRAHVAGPRGYGSHRSASLARHALGIEMAEESIEGLRVTPLATTVAQIAASERFSAGVVVADAALRRESHPVATSHSTVSRADLISAASAIAPNRGGVRALTVARFADARADRPGESLSRACILAAGLPAPDLQVPLAGASGRHYVVDFYWPHLRLIGEFDGQVKYRDPTFLRGRTPEQALRDEKYREDDLRASQHAFSRWGWSVALSPVRLGQQLRRAGLR